MFKVLDIVKEMEVGKNDTGYFASWDEIYAEGGTRNEAVNNLLNEINHFNRMWEKIKIRLFYQMMDDSNNELYYKYPISLS